MSDFIFLDNQSSTERGHNSSPLLNDPGRIPTEEQGILAWGSHSFPAFFEQYQNNNFK
jgi:hypothetical protein